MSNLFMPVRHSSEYILIKNVNQRDMGNKGRVFRLVPTYPVPAYHKVIDEIGGRPVYDDNGKLDIRYWMLERYTG